MLLPVVLIACNVLCICCVTLFLRRCEQISTQIGRWWQIEVEITPKAPFRVTNRNVGEGLQEQKWWQLSPKPTSAEESWKLGVHYAVCRQINRLAWLVSFPGDWVGLSLFQAVLVFLCHSPIGSSALVTAFIPACSACLKFFQTPWTTWEWFSALFTAYLLVEKEKPSGFGQFHGLPKFKKLTCIKECYMHII